MVMDGEAANRENGRKGGLATAEKRKLQRGKTVIIAPKPKCFEHMDEFVQELILSLAETEDERDKSESKSEQKEQNS